MELWVWIHSNLQKYATISGAGESVTKPLEASFKMDRDKYRSKSYKVENTLIIKGKKISCFTSKASVSQSPSSGPFQDSSVKLLTRKQNLSEKQTDQSQMLHW